MVKLFFAFIICSCASFTCWASAIQQDTLMLEFTYKKGGYAYLFLEDVVKIEYYDKTKKIGKLSIITDTLLIITNKQNTYFVKPQNIKKIERISMNLRDDADILLLSGVVTVILGAIGMGYSLVSPQVPPNERTSNFLRYLIATLIGGLCFWWASVSLIKYSKSFNLAKYWSMKVVKQPSGKVLKKLKRRSFYRKKYNI